jgi:dTMP kinase
MKPQDRYDEVLATLDELRELNERIPVIVEGVRDKRALRAMGVRGTILALNGGNPVFALCEAISREYGEAVILTDWDHQGGQLCHLLREGLTANGVRYNDQIRARLTLLCRKDIKDVQGLGGYVERLHLLATAGRLRNHGVRVK